MLNRLIFLFVGLLAACNPLPEVTALPIPETVNIAITPALRPLSAALQACSSAPTEMNLNVVETPAGALNLLQVDLAFRIGQPDNLPEFVVPVAWEEIVIAIHPSNSVGSLSNEQLQALFAGRIENWVELSGSREQVQIWIALEGDEMRQGIDLHTLEDGPIAPVAKLAPDPTAMLEAVSENRGAIGYLPLAWVTEDVKVFSLGIRLPVLALALEQPQGPTQSLLSCLQGGTGQLAILDNYLPWGY
ncbi:MAG: hypothetical protein FVQ83_00460 [Chloroflexi bacterium]|nr:hypothetical protein [Chloroflexota bacterium]